jgi:hypothetical protein
MRTKKQNQSMIVVIAVVLSMGITWETSASAAARQTLTLQVTSGEYHITHRPDGAVIEMEGSGRLMDPGKPMLPAKSFSIALPPGARVQSIEVEGVNAQEITGRFKIVPAPPILPMADFPQFQERIEELQEEWKETYQAAYSTDSAYPEEIGKLEGTGTLRKYSYASVYFYPFSYHPQSGRLVYYPAARISIDYELPPPGTDEARQVEEMKWDDPADAKASRLFVNYDQVSELYRPSGSPQGNKSQTSNYVIITSSPLRAAVVASNFLDWKTSLGYSIGIVSTTDSLISGQAGSDLAEKIRNFLRYHYIPWGIEYVLLVGDCETVPMRYCFPDPANHLNNAGTPNATSGENPTDYYYADLSDADSLSWDSDGDGYYGEYGQDEPDFLAEVYVGRIPTSDAARITYALNKLVAFEQDTSAWKNAALNAGTFWYLSNEDNCGRPAYDGATCMNEIETHLMSGWTISHYSEQGGLETSAYDWPPLSGTAFASDWRNGQYSVVNWGAHGWSDGAARKLWSWDDGDGVPETHDPNEMSWPYFIGTNSDLDDDHPSILFPISCVINYPEPNAWGNLGIDLLTKPLFGACVGVVAATRIVYGSSGWPTNPGGGESMCYEFNRFMIAGPGGAEKVGDAVYDSKFYCHSNYGFAHYAEYWNMVTYNLYGDPSLIREGIRPPVHGDCNGDGRIDLGDVVHLLNYLYKNGPPPQPPEAGDCNCDRTIELGDVVHLINYLFKQGPLPCET